MDAGLIRSTSLIVVVEQPNSREEREEDPSEEGGAGEGVLLRTSMWVGVYVVCV